MLTVISVVLSLVLVGVACVVRLYQPPKDEIPTPSLMQVFSRLFFPGSYRESHGAVRHKVVRMLNFGEWTVKVSSPEAIDAMISDKATFPRKPIQATFLNSLLSQFPARNLNFSNGESWERHKKLVGLPLLQTSADVNIYYDLVACLFRVLDREPGVDMDVLECTKRLTIDSLGRLLMGLELHTLYGKNNSFVRIFHPHQSKLSTLLSHAIPFFASAFNPFFSQDFSDRENIGQFYIGALERRKEALESGKEMYDILSLLLKNQNKNRDLSDQDIVDDITTLLMAGCDATSFSLAIALFQLAKHPEIQESLYQEITRVAGSRKPTGMDIKEMHLLEATIRETMRMYPPSTIISPRIATKDTSLCSYPIPKGTLIVPDLFSLLNDPERWPNPDQFNPDRFLTDKDDQLYLPFGGNERTYMGFGFSFHLQKVAICTLLQRYQLKPSELDDALDFAPSFLTRPKPFRIQFHLRHPDAGSELESPAESNPEVIPASTE